MKLNDMQRSRLKMTFFGTGVLLGIALFCMYIILEAAKVNQYDIVAPWTALGICATSIAGVISYYTNRETVRPSLLTNTTIVGAIADEAKKILPGEDETDPEEMPF